MRIDIWCAFCEGITDPALLGRYREIMTEAERRQEDRFHFPQDRHRYRVTRALLRTTLSRYGDIAPEDWTFALNAYGRPAISNSDAPRIVFNLSHSRRLVVLAVTRDGELGVDTEDTQVRHPPLEIADRFFAPEEVTSLRALAAERQTERFFQHWTLKESYIKARGMGLSLPLDQFAFHFPGAGQVRITIEPTLQDAADNWRFWQWWAHTASTERQHMLALCAQRFAEEPELSLRDIVPLVSESELSNTLIVRS